MNNFMIFSIKLLSIIVNIMYYIVYVCCFECYLDLCNESYENSAPQPSGQILLIIDMSI